MIAYLYDNNNYYLGTTILQESPLEIGVFFDQSNSTRISPPEFKENEIPYWNSNTWEIKPNYSKITLYNKSTREKKKYEIGETPNLKLYTEIKPLENESFQKFQNGKWVIDEESKIQNDKLILINKAKSLLTQTDWTQTLDNLTNRGQEWVNKWASYRVELRKVVNGERETLPEEVV